MLHPSAAVPRVEDSRHRPGVFLIAVIVLSTMASILLPSAAVASSPGGEGSATWGISPADENGPDERASFEYLFLPDSTYTDRIAVINPTAQDLSLTLYASDADTALETGFDLLGPAEEAESVGVWVELEQETITVPAQGHALVSFQIHVPESAAPGDYAGGIVAAMRTTPSTTESGFEIERRVGVRMYLTVVGNQDPALDVEVTQAGFESAGLFPWGSIRLTLKISNVGNTRLEGDITTELRALVEFVALPESTWEVSELLPGQSRTLTIEIHDVPALFAINATMLARTAVVAVDESQPVGAEATALLSTTVWAIPWAIILAALLLAAGVLIHVLRRRTRTT